MTLEVRKKDHPEEIVTLKLPWRIVDALATATTTSTSSGLVAQLRDASAATSSRSRRPTRT